MTTGSRDGTHRTRTSALTTSIVLIFSSCDLIIYGKYGQTAKRDLLTFPLAQGTSSIFFFLYCLYKITIGHNFIEPKININFKDNLYSKKLINLMRIKVKLKKIIDYNKSTLQIIDSYC